MPISNWLRATRIYKFMWWNHAVIRTGYCRMSTPGWHWAKVARNRGAL